MVFVAAAVVTFAIVVFVGRFIDRYLILIIARRIRRYDNDTTRAIVTAIFLVMTLLVVGYFLLPCCARRTINKFVSFAFNTIISAFNAFVADIGFCVATWQHSLNKHHHAHGLETCEAQKAGMRMRGGLGENNNSNKLCTNSSGSIHP